MHGPLSSTAAGNLDFDARVPIPVSVFPSTYRSDATSTETTKTKVEGEVIQGASTSRVGREDTRFRKEEIDIKVDSRRPREERPQEDIRVYEERTTVRDDRYPEVELTRERYQGPSEHRETRPNFDQEYETQIDVTERDYRRRVQPNYDIEYERRRPTEDTVVEKQTTRDVEVEGKMGYYDDHGEYHSFRRGVERAADRIIHPFSHGRREERETVIVEKDDAPVRPREEVRETVRVVQRRGGAPDNSVTIPCHFVRIGDLLILQGRPCQVIRISQSGQTGQYRYLGVDLFTRQLHEESSFVSNPEPSVVVQSMLGPVFKQYRILDISEDGHVVCMTETGDIKQGLPVVDQGGLFGKISRVYDDGRGSVRALVINDGGRELIVDYKVIHGSRL